MTIEQFVLERTVKISPSTVGPSGLVQRSYSWFPGNMRGEGRTDSKPGRGAQSTGFGAVNRSDRKTVPDAFRSKLAMLVGD